MHPSIRVIQIGAVTEITIDKPKANAIDTPMSQALYETMIEFERNDQARVAIITGAGQKFFSAGWDLSANEDPRDKYSPGGFAGLTELFDLSKPVLCAVNGMAVGGGFELALSCDLIVAADHATFFLPEANIGLVPDSGGVLRLPKALPKAIAMEMLLTGKRLSAQEGRHFGLVNQVVPAGELMTAARALAEKIISAAPLSVQAIKEIVRETAHLKVQQGFELLYSNDLPHYRRFSTSQDILEGMHAFNEKRAPVWKGK